MKELVCGIEESDGHTHDASCYEKVLTCGKEVHVHSAECYKTEDDTDSQSEDGNESDPAAADDSREDDQDDAWNRTADDSGNASIEDDADTVQNESADNYIPELDPMNMDALLNDYTDVYYFHGEEGEELPANSSDITEWKRAEDDTELASTDLVKLYFAYTIPAGSLNETNPTARYRLPENIHLTDEQIEAINKNENGFAAGYDKSSPEYQYYLGTEAIEGKRKPDEQLIDGEVEYISAIVRVEKIYDDAGEYIGQDLIFTFIPYTIEKNQKTYDAEQNLLSAGETVTGWFAYDFNLDQIDWEEEEIAQQSDQEDEETLSPEEETIEGNMAGAETLEGNMTEADAPEGETSEEDTDDETVEDSTDMTVTTVIKTADIIFVQEDKEKDIAEISTALRLVEQIEETDAAEESDDTAADGASEGIAEDAENAENAGNTSDTPDPSEDGQEFKDGTLTAEGDGYKITLDYTAEAKIPEGAQLSVREITAETDKETYEECLKQAGQQVAADDKAVVDQETTRFFDIEILVRETDESGEETLRKIEPAAPVSVNIQLDSAPDAQDSKPDQSEPTVLHFAEEGVEQIDSTVNNSQAEKNDTQEDVPGTEVRFEAESFSVYGVVYTVDFHYEVDGKTYEFSIPGGGFVSLEHIVEVLGISNQGTQSEFEGENEAENSEIEAGNGEIGAEDGENTDGNAVYNVVEEPSVDDTDTYSNTITLDNIEVSEATRQFVANVANVEFSSPELASVDPGSWDIVFIRDEKDHSGDQGTLTIAMKDGSAFTIDITITGHKNIDADGIATISSVTGVYLPDGAEGNAAILNEEESREAIASVKELLDISDDEQKNVQYQVFDIGLDGVDVSAYEGGFKVLVNLPENIVGKDFHLYHIHEGVTEEIELSTIRKPEEIGLSTVSKSVEETELKSVSGFEFVTDGFSEFVLSYTLEYSYANYNYVIPVGETVTLQSILDFIHYTVPAGVAVCNVEFSGNPADTGEPQIITIEQTGDGWNLTAVTNFSGDETLTVTFSDGTTLIIAMYCEETHIDGGFSYILYSVENDGLHVLKADGTTEVFASLDDLHKNRLGSEYQWTFYFVYTQYDEGDHLDHVYYLVRPLVDKSKSIALIHQSADLLQTGANNIAVLPQGNVGEGGFIFHGYNNVELGQIDGSFAGVTGNGSTIHIWQQDPLETYEFTVVSVDYKMGYVTTTGTALTKQAEVEQRQSDGTYKTVNGNVTYYLAETDSDKKNNYVITAVPASHTNSSNQNKWEFDYWDLDGEPLYQKNASGDYILDGTGNKILVGATIAKGTLPIPSNGSVLTAHFKQADADHYTVPNGEKEGSTIESMSAWLAELKNRNVPLNANGAKKSAEVYDYENRIYRVDLTAQSSLTTFDGDIDLGFIIDVSGSMNFPSYLYNSPTVTGVRDLSTINNRRWYGDSTQGQRWGLDTNHTYYIIADPEGTATVCYLYYYSNQWWLCDASKDKYTGNGRFDPETGHSADNTQWYNNSYYKTTSYVIMEAGDRVTQADFQDTEKAALLNKHGLIVGDPKTRAYYLELSLNNTIDELNAILKALSIASNNSSDPDVKIAWNTFRNYLPNGSGQIQHNFVSAKNNINLTYDKNTYGGGTSTDVALLDAAGVNRNDVSNRYSDTDRKNWDTDNNINHTYTLDTTSGFQWEQSATRYAVLITDGAPQRSGNPITTRYVEEAAQQLKDRDVNLVTVGLGIDNVTSGKILLYDIADVLNNEKMFYSAKTGDELEDVLLQIVKTIMIDATVQGNVSDTINEAFYPVNKNTGKPLEAGQMVDLQGNVTTDASQPHGTITYKEVNVGTEEVPVMEYRYGVEWTAQDFTWEGWHGSVYIKAKEDFLGGNAVKTNTGSATVEATSYKTSENGPSVALADKKYINNDLAQGEDPHYVRTASFESPRVNVNELGFLWNDTEWNVYLGTSVDPLAQIKKLWDEILVSEVVKDEHAIDSNGDGLPDKGIADEDNNWYPLTPDSIVDDREGEGTGDKQTFKMADLIKLLAESVTNPEEQYAWWDYTKHEPAWEEFLKQATTGSGIVIPYHVYGLNDNSNITITLTKEIIAGEKYFDDNSNEVTLEAGVHATKITGDAVEKYTLKILFSPDYSVLPEGQGGSSTTDFHIGIYGTTYQGHAAGTETSTNTHTINVYAKTIEVEKRKPAANDTTALLTDKPATFSIYRKWKEADGEDKKVSLEGYTLGGTTIGAPASNDDYYYLVESKQTENGVAKFTAGLSAADDPYYLAETVAPEGYQQNKALQTITVTPGPNTTTTKPAPSVTTTVEGAITATMPYDWTQGVRFYFDGSEAPAVYVDSSGTQIVPITGDGARTYVLPSDEDGYFATSVLNEPLASLQLKKQVTINDFDPASSTITDKTVADGTYIIDIVGKEGTVTAGKSYTVRITITNGAAVAATVKDNTVSGSTDTPVTLTRGVLEIPNMLPGEYTVTEDEDSKTVLTAINSTDDSAVAEVDNRKITITLDGNAESVQLVTLTNNYADNSETDIAHISVRKTFVGLKPGMKLPEGFNITVKVTATIDGQQKVLNYTLTGATDTANGVRWNQSVNADGDVVWDWKIAIKGLQSDARVEVQEVNYTKPGYDVTTSANPGSAGGDGTSYTGTVSPSTTVQSIATVITEQNSLVFPLEDKGTEQTIFIARIVPSQTSLVISKNKLNLSERAALEEELHDMPNAEDWYNNTPPMYYTFEDAANNQITVRNSSTVTYFEEGGKGYIRFSKKAQWNMVASRKIIYVDGRPADFNFTNSYTEKSVGIDIVKVDKSQRTTKLPGAVFTLTKLDETTKPGHIVYKKIAGTDTFEKQEASDPTDNNGATSFSNLTSGYYEIKETKTPTGYVLEGDGCIYVKIEDGVANYLAVSEDEETAITEWTIISQTSAEDLVQVTVGRADDPTTAEMDETVDTLFSVGNTPGAALPNTGGPGTSLICLLGIMLTGMAGAGLLLRRRRGII